MATKVSGGNAKGQTNKNPKYLGIKKSGGQEVQAGQIIVRQKGNLFHPSRNTFSGRDFTIHAKINGIVEFLVNKKRRYVRVVPLMV